ncbi:MAG TPA: LamG domain-containing protein [Thermoanaerobaculia bacterium]|nr:LamG domain-containing protein [Thermoanaerobaculia bacterium]
MPDVAYTSLKLFGVSSVSTKADIGVALNGTVPFSIDAWARFTGLGASAAILSKTEVFTFAVSGDQMIFEIAGFPRVGSNRGKTRIGDEVWHHLCATFQSGATRLYIDGAFNHFATIRGTGSTNTNPVLLGNGLQGFVRSVRVFNRALTAEEVSQCLFGVVDSAAIAASFDFSQNPPMDLGPGKLPLKLEGNAAMVTKRPAMSLTGTAYAQPVRDEHVNPGGQRLDPYTVQAAVWLAEVDEAKRRQTIYVNRDLESETGMALLLEYDDAKKAFAVRSLRGSSSTGDSVLSTKMITLKTWANVATTFDGVKLVVYIDGEECGTRQCGPIPLSRNQGNTLIGAALAHGLPSGETSLKGYMGRVDIWSRALTINEIVTHISSPPQATAEGLAASYDVTVSPAKNIVNGNPVGLVDGAAIDPQISLAVRGVRDEPMSMPVVSEIAAPPLRVEDYAAFADQYAALFAEANERDAAYLRELGCDEESIERMRASWSDLVRRLREDPASLPFLLTEERDGNDRVLRVFTHGESYIAYRAPADAIPPCTMWIIKLIFAAIGGILMAFFAVKATLSDRAIAFIQRLTKDSTIMRLVIAGKGMTSETIFELGGALYAAGALRELIASVLDVGIFALIRIVARSILIFLGTAAAIADILTGLGIAVITFLYIYLKERPERCNELPVIDLVAIRFNHDPLKAANDALSIRRNATTDMPPFEWRRGNVLAEESPAAYVIPAAAAATTVPLTIQVQLTTSNRAPMIAQVRAVGTPPLGDINAFTVLFNNGRSVPITIQLPHATLAAGGVRRVDMTWNWSYKTGSSDWLPLTITSHRIYVTLGMPTLPWVQGPTPQQTQLPWTEVLDYACQWAKGATTVKAAATAITKAVNEDIGLKYQGNRAYTVSLPMFNTEVFLLTAFLRFLLRQPGGRGDGVNCSDCAAIVVTFANAIGCDLRGSIMGVVGIGFKTNKIMAIGSTVWNYPFATDPKDLFNFHEVAWTTGANYRSDPLYDACLKVDGGDDPWDWTTPGIEHKPLRPVDIVFTSNQAVPIQKPFKEQTYRERLAQNSENGIGKCNPSGPWVGSNGGRRQVM